MTGNCSRFDLITLLETIGGTQKHVSEQQHTVLSVAEVTESIYCTCCRNGHEYMSALHFMPRWQLQASTAGRYSPPSGKLSQVGCPEAALLPCLGQWCAAARLLCRIGAWPGSSVMIGNAEHVYSGHALCCDARL